MDSPFTASLPLILLLAAIVAAPFAARWYAQRRTGLGHLGPLREMRVISATAIGPHQRVLTIEAGPADDRVWLVLGVTSAQITALHCAPAPLSPPTPPGTEAASPGAARNP
jgi:flagellar protein FliO/FliZ